MTTMDDETLRRLLAAAPPGPWRTMQSYAGPWWVGRTGPCGCQRPDCDRGFTVVDDEHGAELAALAPALAAEVLRLRAERGDCALGHLGGCREAVAAAAQQGSRGCPMSAPDDDTLRAMLAARTPGEWAPYCDEGPIRYRYLAPDGDGWTYSVCVGGHDDDHTCVLTATGPDVATARANAALAALAPALAAEVLRLRAERDELRAVCDDLHIDVVRARDALDDMRARAEKAEAERDAIRAAADEYARSHARKGGDQ